MSLGYKDPRWQKKRLERFEAAGWECQQCRSKKKELNLHHYWYEKGSELWDYPDECFAVLCDECHVAWHEKKQFIDRQMRFTLLEMDQVAGLIAGFQCQLRGIDFVFEPEIDGVTIAGIIRGFWPPIDYQKLLLDECLLRVSRDESFTLSEVVGKVIPIDLPEFAWMAHWHATATGTVR